MWEFIKGTLSLALIGVAFVFCFAVIAGIYLGLFWGGMKLWNLLF